MTDTQSNEQEKMAMLESVRTLQPMGGLTKEMEEESVKRELESMRQFSSLLLALPTDARRRVLQYFWDRYGQPLPFRGALV